MEQPDYNLEYIPPLIRETLELIRVLRKKVMDTETELVVVGVEHLLEKLKREGDNSATRT